MESMCQKQREDINKYKAHVGELSSQLWSVGEKLLIEQQQKQDAMQRLKELQIKIKEAETSQQQVSTVSHRTTRYVEMYCWRIYADKNWQYRLTSICYSLEKQEMLPENAQQMTHKVTLITEETFQRRRSIRNIQAMSNAFKVEDEEEVFDNVYLGIIRWIKRGDKFDEIFSRFSLML